MAEQILIIDGSPVSRILLRTRLCEAHYKICIAEDAARGLARSGSEAPDLILLAFNLPDLAGCDVLQKLREDPRTAHIQVIALLTGNSPAEREAALSAGADEVMAHPPDYGILQARLRNLLRGQKEGRLLAQAWGNDRPGIRGLAEPKAEFRAEGTIGLVAKRPETAMGWRQKLPQDLRKHSLILRAEDAGQPGFLPGQSNPDVWLLDADLPLIGGGLRLMSQITARPSGRDSLCCIVMPDDNPALSALAFDLGADDVIPSSFSGEELQLRLRSLLRRKRERERETSAICDGLRLSVRDQLTGLYNRHYALPRLRHLQDQALFSGQPLSVLLLDLDRFKRVNDSYGHAAGDAVLREAAQRLSENLRQGDLLARLGGEEFLIALPGTAGTEAGRVAERLRAAIAARPFDGAQQHPPLWLTISIGLNVSSGDETTEQMLEAADQALRFAKAAGRNLVAPCSERH